MVAKTRWEELRDEYLAYRAQLLSAFHKGGAEIRGRCSVETWDGRFRFTTVAVEWYSHGLVVGSLDEADKMDAALSLGDRELSW